MLLSAAYQDLFRGRQVMWLNRWGYSCLGLDRLCPVKLVTCVDDSATHDLIETQRGARFLSLDRKTGRRTAGHDSALNAIVPGYRAEIESILRADSTDLWALVSPIPCRSLAEFAAETGRDSICPPPDLGHWLNDKVNFLAALESLGLPKLPGRWIVLSQFRYPEIASEMGCSFVAQLARGVSGSGTAFISSETGYTLAGERFGELPVWVAPDLGDLSLNINAVALESGTAVGYPSVQLTGLPMLGCQRGMYCGNDYTATREVGAPVWQRVVEQTRRIGRWLSSLGFRGLFGLDFTVDCTSGETYAVDLNPRWQGSTGLLTMAEHKAGRLPLVVAGLAWQMGLLDEQEILRHSDDFLQPVMASHMSLRNGAREWAQVSGALRPGVYSPALDGTFLRSGLYLDDLRAPEEILVNGGVPRQGAWMGEGAHILRVASEQAVMDVPGIKPRPWSERAVQSLYRQMDLRISSAIAGTDHR